MTRTLTMLTLAAAAALAGCNNEDHTIVADPAGPDPMANAIANAGPVVLPPAIAASKSYRCKDNSLVSIDWLSDGTARIKAEQAGAGTTVTPGAEGSPLSGDPQAATVTYNGQSCKA
jgi:hypothetical protein